MGRPAKAIAAKTGTITKAEEAARREVEDILSGDPSNLVPPDYLTDVQVEIYNSILECLTEAKVIGQLDGFILAGASVCISNMIKLDEDINENPDLIYDKNHRAAKSELAKQFFKYCNELCLSPQARAKLSISVVNKPEEKKSLMDILNDDDE